MGLPHHRSVVRKEDERPHEPAGSMRPVRSAFQYFGVASDPVEIVHVPCDLIAGNAELATSMYHGEFSLAGENVTVPGLTPFRIDPPSGEWRDQLAGFAWLRHIRAADSAITHALGRALALDWIDSARDERDQAYAPEIAARRIISWLQNATVLGLDQPGQSQPRIMRSLIRQVHHLSLNSQRALEETDRLVCQIAVVLASLSVSALAPMTAKAAQQLERQLKRQILPDGGHRSRNPEVLVDLMLDLLPLCGAFTARAMVAPDGLINAIDRMAPLLRFFLHGDGGIAIFNGARSARRDDTRIVLDRAGSCAKPPLQAPHSGFQRLAAGSSVILVDTGQPSPRGSYTGPLAFELSDGRHRIVTNAGVLASAPGPDPGACGGISIETGMPDGVFTRLMTQLGRERARDIPIRTKVERSDAKSGILIEASHDAFVRRARLAHTRTLFVSADGLDVRGEDTLTSRQRVAGRDATVKLRFALDPALRVSSAADGSAVIIVLANRVGWQFNARGAKVRLEDYIAGHDEASNPVYASRITLMAKVDTTTRINWSFKRVSKAVARSVRPADTPDLFATEN